MRFCQLGTNAGETVADRILPPLLRQTGMQIGNSLPRGQGLPISARRKATVSPLVLVIAGEQLAGGCNQGPRGDLAQIPGAVNEFGAHEAPRQALRLARRISRSASSARARPRLSNWSNALWV